MYAEKKTIMASLLLAVPRRHFCFVSSWLFFFFFFSIFLVRFVAVLFIVSICLVCD